MTINVNEAFEVEEFGVAFTDNDGDVKLYLSAGDNSPIGNEAPVPTLYAQSDGTFWIKFGPANSDWREIPTGSGGGGNIDGGGPDDVYTPEQIIDGGVC